MVGIAAWMLVAGCWPTLVRGVRGFTRDGSAPSAATGEEQSERPADLQPSAVTTAS
jgi:hypothetical protein